MIKVGLTVRNTFPGKSVSTVRRIVLEGHRNEGIFGTPAKHRKGRPTKALDDFDKCAVRQKIQFFYTVKKQVPTLAKLLAVLKEDVGFDGSREHLRRLLKTIGFKYKRCQANRAALLEKPIIASKREKYLKVIMDNRNLPEQLQKQIIYLDESYIHSSYKIKKCWQSIDTVGVTADVSKGKRWILVHAGTENGFIPNAMLIFSGTNKQEDYHSEMNQHNFTKWMVEKLIPNLNEASIIVMDNAPYHSVVKNKAPTSSSKVDEIKLWLLENNIPFDSTLRKPTLLELVKKNKPDPVYVIDEILGEHGHTVVRLPPYHCDLNPIELIWSLAKRKVASQNVGAGKDIKQLTEEAFNLITPNDWKQCCEHVKRIEKEYFERGRTLYDDIDRLVIHVGEDSSEDSSETGSEDVEDEVEGVEYLDFDLLSSTSS